MVRRPWPCMYACVCLLLGRAEHLHDDGVAAGERGPQLPGLHHQREVPALSSSVTPAAGQPATLPLTELIFSGTQGGMRRARGQGPSGISMLPDCCHRCVQRPKSPPGGHSPHHGMIWPTTPIGSFRVYTCSLPSVGIVWPGRKKEDCVQHRTLCFADALSMLLRYCK